MNRLLNRPIGLVLAAGAVIFGSLLWRHLLSESLGPTAAVTSTEHTSEADHPAATENTDAAAVDTETKDAPIDAMIDADSTSPSAAAGIQQPQRSIIAQAISYSQILDRAAGRTDAEAAYDRAYAASLCGEATLADLRARRDTEPRSVSRQQQAAFFERFCDRPAESGSELQRALDLHADSDSAMANQLDALLLTDSKHAIDLAMQLLLESESPDAIRTVQRFLHLNRNVSINLGEAIEGIPSGVDATRARGLALEMLACHLSGACGANSAEAWRRCGGLGLCAPGISMPLIWNASYSKIELEHAQRMFNGLLALRRR